MTNNIGVYAGVEKRKSQRLNLPLQVKYRIIGQRNAQSDAKCVNISGGGIRLCMGEPLEVGHKLEMAISIPTTVKPVVAVGKVVWAGKTNGQFEGGLQFIKMTLKVSFTEYLCEEMVNLSVEQEKVE